MKPWTVLSNLHDRELLAQIEAVDAFMDRMHAYPGRTFGQLYHRFFRTNDLADGALRDHRRHARPRRRARAGAVRRRPRRRHRAGRGLPSRRVAAPARARRARHRAGRPPRRPHRPRRGRDDVADPRRVPRRARSCKAPCTAGKAARSRCLSGYPSRPMRAIAPLTTLLLLLVLAVPAAAQTPPPPEQRIAPGVKAGGLDVGNLTVGEAAVKLQQTYGPPLYNAVAVHVGGQQFRLTPEAEQAEVRHGPDRQARLPRGPHQPGGRRPARHQLEQGPRPHASPGASPARSTSRRATPRSASRCATSSAASR